MIVTLKITFSKKSDLSQIQIEKENLKKFLASYQIEEESNESTVGYKMTDEELDLEEERENLRRMLISTTNDEISASTKETSEQDVAEQSPTGDTWTVPTNWSNSKPEIVSSTHHHCREDVQKNSEISEMWMPTTQLQFAGTYISTDSFSSYNSDNDIILSYLNLEVKNDSQDENSFNENLANNDDTELEAEFDEEIETEINQSYRVNDSYDMTNGDPFYEYQLQLDKMVNVNASQNMPPNVPR